MQFANDCDWIAAAIADRARAADDEVALTAAELRECALRVRMQQMVRATILSDSRLTRGQASQRAAITECLDEASRFRNTSDEPRFAACQRAVKQVGYTLERLAHVWRVRRRR